MGLKASLSKPFARAAMVELRMRSAQPGVAQIKQLNEILKFAEKTSFGKDHNLREGMSLESFQSMFSKHNNLSNLIMHLERRNQLGHPKALWPGRAKT